MTPPNPWAWLRSHPDIDLVWGGLPTGWRGATDGRTIWLADGLTQRERRCTLAHEIAHISLGLLGRQSASSEGHVRVETARMMLPDIEAIAAALSDQPIEQAALDLWVTDDLLADRLSGFSPWELAYITGRINAA